MNLFVPKIYRLRQRICLEIFNNGIKGPVNRTIDVRNVAITVADMAKRLKVSEDEINMAAYGCDEEDLEYKDFGKGTAIVPKAGLIPAVGTQKYITQGRKVRVDTIKDNLYIIISAIAIISAITSLLLYTTSIKNTQTEVSQLRREVKEMKTLLSQGSPQKK